MDENQRQAYAALDRAIEMLVAASDAPDGHIATDAVLIVGCQGITDEGFRVGGTGLFMKGGIQPVWITRALVNEAAVSVSCTCSVDD